MREAWAAIHFEDSRAKAVAVLTADFRKEEGLWLAECLELGTAAYADTLEDARQELAEALTLQLNEIEALGFVEEFLRDRGVKPLPLIPTQPESGPHSSSWGLPVPASA